MSATEVVAKKELQGTTNTKFKNIIDTIISSFDQAVQHPDAKKLVGEMEEGDLLVINNSFVFRKVSTVKSQCYLCSRCNDKSDLSIPEILSEFRMNLDFKSCSSKSKNLILKSLEESAKEQIKELGTIVFVLISEIDDSEVIDQKSNHATLQLIRWNPKQQELVQFQDQCMIIRDIDDIQSIWQSAIAHYSVQDPASQESLKIALESSIEELEKKAVANLKLPEKSTLPATCLTDSIVTVLKDQLGKYSTAVLAYDNGNGHESSLNDILRIAYSFASDSLNFLQLIVSICDLKPIVLWGTIAQHIGLSAALKDLPWFRTNLKPSAESYRSIIADARNRAFHNLFPFRKSLQVSLPDLALRKASLHLFSEYRNKKLNRLEFQDKELVDVLIEFTRARERILPPDFWSRNEKVMTAIIDLFQHTSDFLKILYVYQQTI